ncbi:hypothetical protein ACHAXR_013193, partial [Thalassiosira sp. AJA248-18]
QQQQQQRTLKKINAADIPRRPPISPIDPSKRAHALPLETSALLSSTVVNPAAASVRSSSESGSSLLQQSSPPYYPHFPSHTCHNSLNDYPDHYLYDISAYFFHSPRECCEAHFGNGGSGIGSVDHCMKGIVYSVSGMGMKKKEAFRAHPPMAQHNTAGGGGTALGKKKPMNYHHDTTSWHHGSGGKSGKAAVGSWDMDDDWAGIVAGKTDKDSSSSWYGSGGKSGKKAVNDDDDWAAVIEGISTHHGTVSSSGGKSTKAGVVGTIGGGGGKSTKAAQNANEAMIATTNDSSWYSPVLPSGKAGKLSKGVKASKGGDWSDDDDWSPSAPPPPPVHDDDSWHASKGGKAQIKCETIADDDWWGGGDGDDDDDDDDWWGGGRALGGWPGGWDGGWDSKSNKSAKDSKHYKVEDTKSAKVHMPKSPKMSKKSKGSKTQVIAYDPTCYPTFMPTLSDDTPEPTPATNSAYPTFMPTKSSEGAPTLPPALPTYAPTAADTWPTYSPTANATTVSPTPKDTYIPTFSPTPADKMPTYSPTSSTWPPSWQDDGYNTKIPTYAPTSSGTTPIPTYAPTAGYTFPTYEPTSNGTEGFTFPTYNPTPSATFPTYAPTPNGTIDDIDEDPTEYPTFMPTEVGTNASVPTYMPSPSVSEEGTFPTYAPTSNVTSSMVPTPAETFPTYAPTSNVTSAVPTPAGTFPTYAPTSNVTSVMPTSAGTFPTYAPTSNVTSMVPTPAEAVPTSLPTFTPSYAPTLTTSKDPLDLLVWGSPISTSQPESDGNILIPLDTDIDAIAAAAGTKYSMIIYPDGTAYTTGYIESMDNYQGHLGIRPQELSEGQTIFTEITRVFDSDMGGVTFPPQFVNVFAGVESTPGEGDIHTLLLDGRGNVWATGANDMGQLCLGDNVDRLIPERIPLPESAADIVDVAIGGEHTLLLDKNGIVWACGSNTKGQLGLGEALKPSTNIPLKVYFLDEPATSISAGKDHSLIIADNGNYVMGSNKYGQLCVDTDGKNLFVPRALDVDERVVVSFEATRLSTYILYVDGSVNACGRNEFGQLGDGTTDDVFLTTVAMPQDQNVVKLLGVGPSANSVFFVAEDETVWGTGLNDHGQLGVGDEDDRNVPTKVQLQDGVIVHILSAAEDHTLALKEGGVDSIVTYTPSYSPTPVVTIADTTPTYAPTAPGTYSPSYNPTTNAPTQEGNDMWFWGAPEAIGQKANEDVLIPLLSGPGVVHASAGSMYSIIILQDGSALSSGYIESMDDYSGHLGRDPTRVDGGMNAFQPINKVHELTTDTTRRLGRDRTNKKSGNLRDNHVILVDAPRWSKAFAGVEHTPDSGIVHSILLDNKGQAWATGSNSKGQLCLGDDVDRMIPEKIPLDGRIVDVAIGGEHTLLLDEDGNVYGCGSNNVGQLGLGKKQAEFSPTIVDGISTVFVSSISAGHSHSLFMAPDDGIYFSGSNEYGQLCTDGENVLTPKALNIDERVAISFEAIKESSYILYEDGSVNACGRNNFGQLGNGAEVTDDFIVTVELNERVVRLLGVGPSAESVFFYTTDERVWGTGLNDRGQLGVGNKENRNLPTFVMFEGPVVDAELISVSEVHSIALATVSDATFPPRDPTYAPSSPVPTYAPTVELTPSPTRTGLTMWFWGAPDSIGQDSMTDQLIPVESGEDFIDVGSGSKYTVIILPDGSAVSTGYIDSLEDYKGHLGIEQDIVVKGINELEPISKVYDADELAIVDAPMFDRVFAGVENSPNSGVVHTILLDNRGRAWAMGSNSKGQLCLGDSVDQVMIPERIPAVAVGRIVDVAIGGEHTLLLGEFGNVYGCGSNSAGQLGLGMTFKKTSVPTMIDTRALSTTTRKVNSFWMNESNNHDSIFYLGWGLGFNLLNIYLIANYDIPHGIATFLAKGDMQH